MNCTSQDVIGLLYLMKFFVIGVMDCRHACGTCLVGKKRGVYYATTFSYAKPQCHPRLGLLSGDAQQSKREAKNRQQWNSAGLVT